MRALLERWAAGAAAVAATALDACREATDAERRLAERASDSACPAVALDRLRAHRDAAVVARAEALAPLYAAGLRRRVGTFLVNGYLDRAVYDVLDKWCAAVPGVLVCSRCSRVFEPRRKGHAWLCEPCHDRQDTAARKPLPFRPDGEGRFFGQDGRVWFRFAECERCGEPFYPRRSDARYCGEACGRAAGRGSPLPERIVERQRAVRDAHEAMARLYAEHPDYAEAMREGARRHELELFQRVDAVRLDLAACFPDGITDDVVTDEQLAAAAEILGVPNPSVDEDALEANRAGLVDVVPAGPAHERDCRRCGGRMVPGQHGASLSDCADCCGH